MTDPTVDEQVAELRVDFESAKSVGLPSRAARLLLRLFNDKALPIIATLQTERNEALAERDAVIKNNGEMVSGRLEAIAARDKLQARVEEFEGFGRWLTWYHNKATDGKSIEAMKMVGTIKKNFSKARYGLLRGKLARGEDRE